MKRFQLFFSTILLPLDAIILVSSACLAYVLRVSEFVSSSYPVLFELNFSQFFYLSLPWAFFFILINAFTGTYIIQSDNRLVTQIKRVLAANVIVFAGITITMFITRTFFDSRFILLFSYIFLNIFSVFSRLVLQFIKKQLHKRAYGVSNTVLLGDDENTVFLESFLKDHPEFGLHIVQTIPKITDQTISDLTIFIQENLVDVLFIATTSITKQQLQTLSELAIEHHIDIQFSAAGFASISANNSVYPIAGIPIVRIHKTSLDGWGRVYKRLFDIILGSCLFLIFSPIMLITAMAIKLESNGNIIYKNERVGKNGKHFFIYKFRRFKSEFNTGSNSSKANQYEKELIKKHSKRQGPLYKVIDDPRNTRVGAFIERYSIDELPQFLNVIKGDMSLIGPRPHQPREVELYEKHHKYLLSIKPGVTGLAQISGRSDLHFEDEYKLDRFYIQNWSILTDLSILIKTPFALLKKHN